MINKIFLSFISVITIFLLISCNDSPTDLGKDYLDRGFGVYTFDSSLDSMPQHSSDFINVYSLGASSHLLIGKAENVTAHSLIRFIFPIADSIKTELASRNLTVIDSWVELVKDYRFGDSAATFDYEVFKINSGWTSSYFTADSLENLPRDNTDLSFNRTTENDTLYSFHIDTTLVSSWLQEYADTLSTVTNYGILISPTPGTQKVLGFTAYNTSRENDAILRIVVQKPGEYIDTLVGLVDVDVSVVLGDRPNVSTENLAIQSSLTSEAKLFFDLNVLPKDITINSAKLTLTVDTIQTKTGSSFTNSLRTYLLVDSLKDSVNANYAYTLSRIGSTFSGEITNIVRAWNNKVSNQGMLIKATGEIRGVEIFAIKGSNTANITERPKLEIVYSKGGNK